MVTGLLTCCRRAQKPSSGDSVTCVAGQWTVPDVVAPGPGNYYASEWVGIDGDGSPDVLQEGTETELGGLGDLRGRAVDGSGRGRSRARQLLRVRVGGHRW